MNKIKVIIHSLQNCGSCSYGKRLFEESLVNMGCVDKVEVEVKIHENHMLELELSNRITEYNKQMKHNPINTFPIFEIIEDEISSIHNLTTAMTTIYWRTKR